MAMFGSDKSNKEQEQYNTELLERFDKLNQIFEKHSRDTIQLLLMLVQQMQKKDQQIENMIHILEQKTQQIEGLIQVMSRSSMPNAQKSSQTNVESKKAIVIEQPSNNISPEKEFVHDVSIPDVKTQEKAKPSQKDAEKKLLTEYLPEFMKDKLEDRNSDLLRQRFNSWDYKSSFSDISFRNSSFMENQDNFSIILLFLDSEILLEPFFGANTILYVRSTVTLKTIAKYFNNEKGEPSKLDFKVEKTIEPAYLKHINGEFEIIKKGKVKGE